MRLCASLWLTLHSNVGSSTDQAANALLERRLRLKVNCALEQIAGILEVLSHSPASLLRLSTPDRLKDALVQLKCVFRFDELRSQPHEPLE